MKHTIKSIRKAITLTVLLLSGLQITAQNACPEVKPDTPPSPQAVAFNRLGDYQVNNNYGMPDINIPLFEIDFHGYKIPLTLHYEATPMKPGYNYDVTGFGWTLSGNSCVSRTIKDRADEIARENNPFALDPFNNNTGQEKRYMDFVNELDNMNFQYDSYNIVLPSGRNIPFFMYMSENIMQYDRLNMDREVIISCTYTSHSIDTFTVTDESGIIYHFTVADKASNGFENDPNADRNVTWLLTSIDIPSKGTITYQYTDLQSINTYNIDEPTVRVSRLVSARQEDVNDKRLRVMKINQSQSPRYRMRFLQRIIYGPTQVEFNYSNDGLHMREIVVSDCGNTVKKFTLNISSYGSANAASLSSLVITGQNNTDRLEYHFGYYTNCPGDYVDYWGNRCNPGPSLNNSNGNSLNNHGLDDLGNFNIFFDYDGIGWGWNENQQQLSQNGMLAQLIENEPDDHSYYWKMKLQTTTEGDTRVPTPPELHGVLSSITYPNGGRTIFSWENHRFPTATAADGDFVFDRRSQRIIEGGGFRIESITNVAADGTNSTDYYRYGFRIEDIINWNFPLPLPDSLNINTLTFDDNINHHIGCGEAVVDPNVLTFMTYSHATTKSTPFDFQRMILGLPSSYSNITVYGHPTWWDAVFSTSTFRSLLGGRRPVVYPEITVYHGQPEIPNNCVSKTVYKYDIYNYQSGSYTNYLSNFNQTNLPDTAYFEPIYYLNSGMRCMELPAKRHRLKSKSDYAYNAGAHTWKLVSNETYSYSEDIKSKSGFIFESEVSRGHCYLHTLQLGAGQPLESFNLRDFYQTIDQKIGRSTMIEKTTTTLRSNGVCTEQNTLIEDYSYLYSGVLRYKYYTDGYDKGDWYSYAVDGDSSDPAISEMVSRNMLAFVTSAETCPCDWPSDVTGSKIDYDFFGNKILPSLLYERNGNNYEESIKVLSYDSYGNPTEIVNLKTGNEQTGVHTVYLWDTYGRYMLAMIQNATLSQVGDTSQLSAMPSWARRTTLQALLPNAKIQTWDYLPLIGVSSHTDVNGQTLLYEYDGLGRLKYEKRRVNGVSDPEILHEYEYNYRNVAL